MGHKMNHENRCRTLMSLGICCVLVAHMAFLNLAPPWNLRIATPLAVGGLGLSVGGLWLWDRRGIKL